MISCDFVRLIVEFSIRNFLVVTISVNVISLSADYKLDHGRLHIGANGVS